MSDDKQKYDGYNFEYEEAMNLLKNLAKQAIISKYPIDTFVWDENLSRSYIKQCPIVKIRAYSNDLTYDCVIGTQNLESHKKVFADGTVRVRDVDLVGNVKNIFHESEHLNQHLNICQKPLSGEDLDMAKMLMLNDLLYGYKVNTYLYNLSEICADITACKKTVNLFYGFTDDKGRLIFDVRNCLFQYYQEHDGNRVWKSGINVYDYNSLMKSLYHSKTFYLTADRGITFTNHTVDQSILADIKKSQNWKQLFYGDRTGKQYDDKLFAIVDTCAPQWSQTHAGIRDEAKRLRKEYPRNFPPLEHSLKILNQFIRQNRNDELK